MQQVDAAFVELLSSLFGAPELRRLLQRETWGVKLVLAITSSEQTAPNDWFHDLVVAVNQRGLKAELRALMLRERDKRAAEIWAVLPDVDPARVGPRAAEVAPAPRAVVTPQRPNTVTVEPEQPSPSLGWRGFVGVVVFFCAVGALVNFMVDDATPVKPVAELAPAPVIGPCGVPLLGGPTGETHTPRVEGLDMPFVGLSAGQFCMGSPDGVGEDDERPQHPVKVAGCMMGKSEVRQAQWRSVVKAAKATKDVDAAGLNEDPSHFKGDTLPIESVSWCDVTRFANALSRLDSRAPVYEISDGCAVRWIDGADGYRLPTEAEWEYAARAGTTTAYATGDDEAALALAGWYGAWPADEGGNSGGKTHDVCTAPREPWGLCDLHGNVWEWVFDAYDIGTYARSASASTFDGSATLTETASSGAPRVLRGGSWEFGPEYARSAYRSGSEPSLTGENIGFRLLLCPPERP